MASVDLWYATRATGLTALVLLTATMALGILVAGRAESIGPRFARVELHKRISVLAMVFLAIHIVTSVADTYVHIGVASTVVPFSSGYDTMWVALGTISVDLMAAVAISSALRQRISPRLWRLVHWLAYFSWPLAVAHTLGMGTDMGLAWVLGLVAACIAGVVGVGTWRVADALVTRSKRPNTVIAPRPSLRRAS